MTLVDGLGRLLEFGLLFGLILVYGLLLADANEAAAAMREEGQQR